MAEAHKRGGAALNSEPRRKKRKLLSSRFEVVACGPNLGLLPDNIVLCIMALLDVRSVVLLSRVCKRFHQLHRDESVWRDVDLTQSANPKLSLDSRLLKKLISRLLQPSTKRVKLSSRQRSKPIVTNTILKELFAKCPQIRSLTLLTCDLSLIMVDCELYFCPSLEQLFLENCQVTYKWASTVKPVWPRLIHLSFSGTAKTSDSDLEYFASCKNNATSLRVLDLSGCYRVTNAGLSVVCSSMPNLHTLRLYRCNGLTEDAMDDVAKLEHLRELHFNPRELSTKGYLKLLKLFPRLSTLHVCPNPAVRTFISENEATAMYTSSGVDLHIHID